MLVSISENVEDEGYKVQIRVPASISQDDLSLSRAGDVLILRISGCKEPTTVNLGRAYRCLVSESNKTSIIPADTKKIRATFFNGLLTLNIPWAKTPKAIKRLKFPTAKVGFLG